MLNHKLNRFQIINTNSRDTIGDILARGYGVRSFDLKNSNEPFHGMINGIFLKDLDLTYVTLSVDAETTFDGIEHVKQKFILSGRVHPTSGRSRFDIIGENRSILVPAEVELYSESREHFSQLALRIRNSALQSKLSSLVGHPINRRIDFIGGITGYTSEQSQLFRAAELLVQTLDRYEENTNQFVLAEFEQLLIVLFLVTNPHSFSSLLSANASDVAPWQIRLVEDYLAANWDKPLTVEALSEQTGIGARNIFAKFRKIRGYGPMSFLQRIRLEQARRMLQKPDETTSVTGVALKCLFSNASHFALYYKRAFGESPSTTLSNAIRHQRSTP